MNNFKWNSKRDKAALLLAQGYIQADVAKEIGLTQSTISKWLADIDFKTEVDRLTLMSDVAGRAERLRIAMRAVRQKLKKEYVLTEKDVLDWLKFAQSETDGAKLDLTSLFEAYSQDDVADSRPEGIFTEEEGQEEETE